MSTTKFVSLLALFSLSLLCTIPWEIPLVRSSWAFHGRLLITKLHHLNVATSSSLSSSSILELVLKIATTQVDVAFPCMWLHTLTSSSILPKTRYNKNENLSPFHLSKGSTSPSPICTHRLLYHNISRMFGGARVGTFLLLSLGSAW